MIIITTDTITICVDMNILGILFTERASKYLPKAAVNHQTVFMGVSPSGRSGRMFCLVLRDMVYVIVQIV